MSDGPSIISSNFKWQKIKAQNLDLDYCIVFTRKEQENLFNALEDEIEYFKEDLAKVKVFGKWHPIPRQQASYGDEGLSYKFSGLIVPAVPWTPTLMHIKQKVEEASNRTYNFVLVNRYADGNDNMGEHKDDEIELEKNVPIASISLGAHRDFIFKHESMKKKEKTLMIPTKKIILEPGSLLLMNYPTNKYWYHSLPKRKSCKNVRINLTFRSMKKVR